MGGIVALILGLSFFRSVPSPAAIGWLLYLVGAVVILARPRYGVFLTLFFTLAGDSVLMFWYPFNKNFSSAESLFYISDSLIFSPMELYVVLTLLSMGVRCLGRRRASLRGGVLGVPMAAFALATAAGLVYGAARGGDLNIGLWECRSMFYLPLSYFLSVNLVEDRRDVAKVVWAAMAALTIEALVGCSVFFLDLKMDLSQVEAITEHSAAVHMNALFVMLVADWLFKGPLARRMVLLAVAPFVGITYLATQRRASYVTLAVALLLITVVLYRENRRLFWLLVPPAGLIAAMYLAAFWNSSGALGLPARGLKSVFADSDSAEYSSNIYRVIENINIDFTIRQSPLLGVGFGNKFLILVPMPDISFFEWWEYITHNSVLWVWMKAGLAGFVSTVFMVGTTIAAGARALRHMPDGALKAAGLMFVLYVIMHFTYAYVDMSWDAQSMVFVGVSAGVLANLMRVAARPAPQPRRRWHWQALRRPVPVALEPEDW